MEQIQAGRLSAGEVLCSGLPEALHLVGRAAVLAEALDELAQLAAGLIPPGTDLAGCRAVLSGQRALLSGLAGHLAGADEALTGGAGGWLSPVQAAGCLVPAVRDVAEAVLRLLPEADPLSRPRAVLLGQSALCAELAGVLSTLQGLQPGGAE